MEQVFKRGLLCTIVSQLSHPNQQHSSATQKVP